MLSNIVAGTAIAMLGAVITLLFQRYRNKLVFDTDVISTIIYGRDDTFSLSAEERGGLNYLNSYRIKIENVGFRDLENVELHFEPGKLAHGITVERPTTLSKESINVIPDEKILRINIPHLPSKERFELTFATVGFRQYSAGDIRGTGGKYRLISRRAHKFNSTIINLLIIGSLLGLPQLWVVASHALSD